MITNKIQTCPPGFPSLGYGDDNYASNYNKEGYNKCHNRGMNKILWEFEGEKITLTGYI